MGPSRVLLGLALVLTWSVRTATAQVLEPPTRIFRGLFGGPPPDMTRNRQDFGFTGSLLGGYDDSLVPPTGGSSFVPYPAGYTGFGDVGARYRVGRERRFFEMRGRGYLETYRNVGVGPHWGGEQSLRARTSIGKKTDLEVTEDLRFDPFLTLGLFNLIRGFDITGTPDTSPTTAVADVRSQGIDVAGALTHRFTRKSRLGVSGVYDQQDSHGNAFNRRMVSGSFSYDYFLNRDFGVRASYQPSDRHFTDVGGREFPLQDHTVLGGVQYRHHLSRTREFSWSAGAGPQHVLYGSYTIPYLRNADYWNVAGYGTLRWDFGRTWSIAGDYRRSVSVLEGASPYPFMTNAFLATAGGNFKRWLEAVLTTGYSNGQAGQVSGIPGYYDGFTTTVQARVRLARFWSAVAAYSHYQYSLDDTASLSLGVPPNTRRNSIRVGIAWAVPVVGSYFATPADAPVEQRD